MQKSQHIGKGMAAFAKLEILEVMMRYPEAKLAVLDPEHEFMDTLPKKHLRNDGICRHFCKSKQDIR